MVGLMAIALVTSLRADRLNAGFQQVRVDAAEAASRRQELELGRTRLGAIQAAIVERPNYQYWLNHIAASAPDTVYFDRLNFDGSEVVVSGYSNNASVYLRMLTEQPGYTDVAALSAFARDQNNGLERFSIQWRVTEPPTCLRQRRRWLRRQHLWQRCCNELPNAQCVAVGAGSEAEEGAGSVACSGALSADRCGPGSDGADSFGAGQYFWVVDE
jgi:hypothetical protein